MQYFVLFFWLTVLVAGGALAYRKIKKDDASVGVPSLPVPPESLGATLHDLAQRIETYSQKIIHAREFLNSPDFMKAVEQLAVMDADTIRQYATSGNRFLASAAFEALSRHDERDSVFNPVILQLHALWPEPLHFALRYIASMKSRPPFGAPVVRAQEWWYEQGPIAESYRDYFGQRQTFGDAPVFGDYLEWTGASDPAVIRGFLARVQHPSAKELDEAVKLWQAQRVDQVFLSTFGRFWSGPQDTLVEPERWSEALTHAAQAILAIPPRSVLVTGDARIGKSAFQKLLGERLKQQNWRVFEAGAPELMAGQSYFGELEGRVRRILEELKAEKHVAWCVTDLLQFAESGTHKGQSASLLDQIMPALSAGKLVLLAEASPEGASRLLTLRPSLRTQLEIYKLMPFTNAELSDLAGKVADIVVRPLDLKMEPQAVAMAIQLSQQYLGGGNLPGLVVDLIKRGIQHAAAAQEKKVTPANLLDALSQITGLPIAILDDKERVDLASVRRYFSERVIGQDEAVSAVVDRIAMLKAGLTDPGRPVGVFLFAGPTGTGKTELAKALASYLFGSPERMARLDMSEFQHPDSISKIVGERGETKSDSLIERVRKQPFSVVLLDEFEKAHANVWDLFLQIFDDGRLTDANGRVADFRHSIIILTSNLGATDHRGGAIGFMRTKDDYTETQVLAAVGRAFRPEFVNRLDKIVVFKPLSRDLMRQILNKELRLVLERRGLRNRDWVVEWEASALDFLLDKGFSPEMGARPLKRAIDQFLLAPLAATLVEHRFPEGDQFLFVRSNGKAIEVEFVDPDADLPNVSEATADIPDASLAGMILQPRGQEDERAALAARFAALEKELDAPGWLALKEEAQNKAGAPDIWNDPGRHGIFARVALFDRVNEAMRTASRLKRRLDGGRTRSGQPSRELIGRLALQLHLVGEAVADAKENAPVDAVLAVEPIRDSGSEAAGAAWCARLIAMYRKWGEQRHMQIEELDGLLHVSGFGAFRTLAREAGLHILEDDETRLTARVRVVKGPDAEPRAGQEAAVYAALIAQGGEERNVVRRYRENPAPLVRDARTGWRSGRLDQVLDGGFDLIGETQ